MEAEFSEECMAELKPFSDACNENGEYIIPQEERAKRVDLTKEIICTVDPVTARDLDDALSINELENEKGIIWLPMCYF